MVHQARRTTQENFLGNRGYQRKNNIGKSKADNQRREQLQIKLINIQGLTNAKMAEIQLEIGQQHNVIYCLTETQQKWLNINLPDKLVYVSSMRDMEDKKGGGLSILHTKSDNLETTKLESGHKDILYTTCKASNFQFKLLLVYLATNDQQDSERNQRISSHIEKMLQKNGEDPLVFLGDFNGHLGFIGPQETNSNGNRVLDWAEKFNLVILNGDERCKGEITWTRGEHKSASSHRLCTC